MKTNLVGRNIRLLLLLSLIAGVASCNTLRRQSLLPGAPTAALSVRASWPTRDWSSSTPQEEGMDPQLLASLLDHIRQEKIDFDSLLIIRHGVIVSETYFGNYTPDRNHPIYSITKSFVATLIGIAIDQGFIDGVDQPASDFFPAQAAAFQDPLKQSMDLEHLLSMTSGLEWEEGNPAYREMYMSPDWVDFMLQRPMASAPGEKFKYCTGCSHLLSAALQYSIRMSAKDFADAYLFKPLGISQYTWEQDPNGISIGGYGLEMTPREMARLGYLYLYEGNWDGKQVVSAEWVKTATRKHTATDGELGYGYQWWVYPRFNAYAALGKNGQTVFVAPESDMIIVTTAGSLDHDRDIFPLIEKYIMPAVDRL